jgi:predicted ribosomally synthesized peptide with nif11-like leader
MAQEQVARLYRAAKADPALKERLNQAPNIEAFVAMARELGFDFTVEEWRAMTSFQVEELKAELSEIPGL